MEFLTQLVDAVLHVDAHLIELVQKYGAWTYAILTLVVFLETGIVVTPFLPGDSLLFAAGALAATGGLDVGLLWILLTVAAIVGDTVNYWIGHAVGPRAFTSRSRFLKREHLEKTHAFYEKHGGKTIVLARFMPIVRTFAPFVAGIGSMSYRRFIAYNIGGGVLWTTLFIFGGFFFGNIPAVKDNFTLVILAIIALSVAPGVVEFVRARRRSVA